MPVPTVVSQYAQDHHLSQQESAQIFMQVVVLRHLAAPYARFMGGTALVLGYGNPRFSEDIDLTQVPDSHRLRPSLGKARVEIADWFQSTVSLVTPKIGGHTWRLVLRLGRSESVQLHVDSQPYCAYTTRSVVITHPAFAPFICEALALDEILAEKTIAVAGRRYLAGRDLFDLWFHWLRSEDRQERAPAILALVGRKLKERALPYANFKCRLSARLVEDPPLQRARQEWQRYLPAGFQKASVYNDIVACCRRLPEWLS